jgi:SAM-dependent methyltransferase
MRPRLRALPPVLLVWRRLERRAELEFWKSRGDLIGDGRGRWAYTELFGIEPGFYNGKRLLDVGCGPRGSLDWATQAAARVGIDPLADEYVRLGADAEAMEYLEGVAERMPFTDASFDVVGSFNSLDHVDDVPCAVAEIARVLAPGGTFLLTTELNHRARLMEPQTFGWEVTRLFEPAFEVVDVRRYAPTGAGIGDAIRARRPYDDPEGRAPGVLAARLRRAWS